VRFTQPEDKYAGIHTGILVGIQASDMFDLHLSRRQSHYHLGGLRFGGSQLSLTKVSGLQLYFINPYEINARYD
jgi:hypothetical protein